MKNQKAVVTVVFLTCAAALNAQFATFDAAQEVHALKQIASDAEKIANQHQSLLNDIQKLQKLDAQILNQISQFNQMAANAKSFPGTMKNAWTGFQNRIATNWTTPNSYGETATWNPAVLFGNGAGQAWTNATVAMKRNINLIHRAIGSDDRDMAYTASVNAFDASGPAALQTIGTNRNHQTQMDLSIARLQAAVADGSTGMNSEVQQLNLLTAGSVQALQMQQATNNALTALLEQQTLANKMQRDMLADHMNSINRADQLRVTEAVEWGNAAQTLSTWRMK